MLLTRSPLSLAGPFDLHGLGAPPAFILSQDQTLRKDSCDLRHSESFGRPKHSHVLRSLCHSLVVKVRSPVHAEDTTSALTCQGVERFILRAPPCSRDAQYTTVSQAVKAHREIVKCATHQRTTAPPLNTALWGPIIAATLSQAAPTSRADLDRQGIFTFLKGAALAVAVCAAQNVPRFRITLNPH